MKQNSICVFDMDGVITEPGGGEVDSAVVGYIHRLLETGAHVAINTGRPYAWVQANLLDAIERQGGASLFDHLYIACEKGGEGIAWNGERFAPQPSRFAIAPQVRDICRKIYEENKPQLSSMFWDQAKLTMATIEKHASVDVDKFRQEQQVLVAKLKQALDGYDVKIDPTTIATDIESPPAGKHAGAELIYEWIVEQAGAQPEHFVSFGDSKSDYEMARYFASRGAESAFVFVGDDGDTFDEDPQVALTRTDAKYAAGTREYFAKNMV